jgi:hypothetical protein
MFINDTIGTLSISIIQMFIDAKAHWIPPNAVGLRGDSPLTNANYWHLHKLPKKSQPASYMMNDDYSAYAQAQLSMIK